MGSRLFLPVTRGSLPESPGVYILLLFLPQEKAIKVGSQGPVNFYAGYYVYVGSAMGGLKNRLKRYFYSLKTKRWHIDYLLSEAYIIDVFVLETSKRLECYISSIISCCLEVPGRGLGASDCRCRSHLYYSKHLPYSFINSIG